MAKQWDKLAAKARKIAKNIVTGEEEYKGTRLTAIVYRLDTFATDALNRKYARQGSQASIHTEWGGYQTIDSIHEDGSEGHFDTDGKCESSDNAMDIEIMMYINGGNGGGNNGGSTPSSAPVRRIRESNTRKDMKQNKTTITEAELKNIIAESIKKVLNEKYNPWQRKETENGVIFPRYDADTAKYRKNVVNQASHLYKQIEYFLQTLSHAYPSGSDSFNRTMGARGEEELEAILEQAKSALESYCKY